MKKIHLSTALVCGSLAFCAATAPAQQKGVLKPATEGAKPGEWTLDFDAAKAAASEKKLPILLFKTRDTCGLCAAAKSQLLSQPAWQKFAKNNFFLVWVDLPDGPDNKPGAGIPDKFKDMHQKLAKFNNGGGMLPSFVILDSDGETQLGGWNGRESFHTTEYFMDLLKSYAIMGENKPANAAAAPKKTTPAAAGPIKPATEGAKPGEWTMDYDAALKAAAEAKGFVFLLFTGSDWNPQGKALARGLFGRPGWDKYAKDNNIFPVWVDFPGDASLVPETFAAQNKKLRKEHGSANAFPACALLNGDAAQLMKLGKEMPNLTLRGLQDAIKPFLPKK